ncbi:hypothetical protein [Rhodococcus spongiicola]|uniref:DUF1254 domain-containing protein n=1 Tax=Rhodococcus spongiicola TaxID=2487352 RepID=A0A3S3CM59_9NOCA|nr:hypothetical protein [Rhodococcus spongiicola]RVW00873.1 hypothetical protein EF834_15900 [Rhodococcus spongiicola]
MRIGEATKRALVGAIAAVALGSAVTAPAGAATDPPGSSAAGGSLGSVAPPEAMTTQTLIAARNAGLPIYEAVVTNEYSAPKSMFELTEYRRVYDIDALSSPTVKFVGLGAVAPDTFWVIPRGFRSTSILVNLHETWQDNVSFPLMRWDETTLKFVNSPLVQLPDGGPSIGIARITDADESDSGSS